VGRKWRESLAVRDDVADDRGLRMLDYGFGSSFVHFSSDLFRWTDNYMRSWICTFWRLVRSTLDNESIFPNNRHWDASKRKAAFYLLDKAVIFFAARVIQKKSDNIADADGTFEETGVFVVRIRQSLRLRPFAAIVDRYPVW